MPNFSIEIIDGSDSGHKFDVPQDGLTLGASRKCGIVLSDKKIEEFHAQIEMTPDDGRVFLKDLATPSGTFVNGNPIRGVELHHNDIITVGQTKLLFIQQSLVSTAPTIQASITPALPVPSQSKSIDPLQTKNASPTSNWLYKVGGVQVGPIPLAVLKQLVSSRQLKNEDLVCEDGTATWIPANKIEGLFAKVNLSNEWLYRKEGSETEVGPLPFSVLQQMIAAKQLSKNDLVKPMGEELWKRIREVKELPIRKRNWIAILTGALLVFLMVAGVLYFLLFRPLDVKNQIKVGDNSARAYDLSKNRDAPQEENPKKHEYWGLNEEQAKRLLEDYLKAWCFGKKDEFKGAKPIVLAAISYEPESYSIGISSCDTGSKGTWRFKVICKFKTRGGGIKDVPLEFTVYRNEDLTKHIESMDTPD